MTTPVLSAPDFAKLTTPPVLTPRGYYCSVAPRAEIFSSQIFGLVFIDYQTLGEFGFFWLTTLAGAYTDVREGMTVEFGTTPYANDIGQARVRKVPTAGAFFINEVSPAKLPLAVDIYFTVYDEYVPHLVMPLGREAMVNATYVNSVIMYTDYEVAYSDQNENFTPKANITRSDTLALSPRPAGFVDNYHTASPLTYREMALSAALSFCLDSSITGVLWDVGDGTITVGSTTSATITVRFPVGFRHIRLTVTAANGKIGTRVFPVWVHDATHLPLSRFQINHNSSGDWREMELDFFQQDVSATTIPKGTTLCVWEDDPLWGTTVPDQYRDQMYGWATQTVTLFRKDRARTTLSITGLGEWLDRYRAVPQRLQDPITRSAASWFEMADITLDKLAFYILENFSTANLISNLFLSGVTDLLPALDITGKSLYDQVRYIMQGNYSKIRCKSLNDLQLEVNYQYMTASQRSLVLPTLALISAHWPDESGPKITTREYDVVASVLGSGGSFDGTTNTLYNSRAPGRTPGDSNTEQDASGQNLPTTSAQDVLNQLTGAHYMVLNNARDSVPLEPIYNLDCLEVGDIITATTSDSDSGVVLSADQFIVKEINVSYGDRYSDRGKKINWTLEGVIGPATSASAQWVEVPVDTTQPPDYVPPVDIEPPPIIPTETLPEETGVLPTRMLVMSSAGARIALVVGIDPTTYALTYADRSSGLTGTGRWGYSKPFHYNQFIAAMSTGLYWLPNVEAGDAASLLMNNASLLGNSARTIHYACGSIHRNGFGMVLSGVSGLAYTFDNWSSRTLSAIGGGSADWTYSDLSRVYSSFCMVEASSGHGYGIFGVNGQLYRTTDYCQTWNVVGGAHTFSLDEIFRLEIPYTRSTGAPNFDDGSLELWVYKIGDVHNGSHNGLGVYTTDGSSGVSSVRNNILNGGQSNWDGDIIIRPATAFTNSGSAGYAADEGWAAHTTDQWVSSINGGAVGSFNINGFSTSRSCAFAWRYLSGGGGNRGYFTLDAGATWHPIVPDISGWVSDDGIAYLEGSLYPIAGMPT